MVLVVVFGVALLLSGPAARTVLSTSFLFLRAGDRSDPAGLAAAAGATGPAGVDGDGTTPSPGTAKEAGHVGA
jgi:hypothetical protein